MKFILYVFAGIIIGIIILTLGASWYYKVPLESFCEDVSMDSSPENVITLAKRSGFYVFGRGGEKDLVAILNHRSFVFRYQCNIVFLNGKIQSRDFFTAD